MPDLQVVAVIKAKEGSEGPVGDALAAVVDPTRAEEGCRAYSLYRSQEDKGTFVTLETWRAQADLDAHMATPHIAAAFAAAGDHMAEMPVIYVLEPVKV
jgi:quinol monooxygenase YgiN